MSIYRDTIKLQESLAKQVKTKDGIKKVRTVCAVDVHYRNDKAHAAAVIFDVRHLEEIEHAISVTEVKAPYVPGLMMLREGEPVRSALKLLKKDFDVLLVDGNGQLHPRKCGLACYLGIILNKPSIGVAKSLLCGDVLGNAVKLKDKVVGKIIEKKEGKKIFVSIGNKISLATATKLVESVIKKGSWLPEPIIVADKYSRGLVP